MEFLQINKFGDLQNGRNILFCKTEFLEAEFKRIRKIRSEVILISGNSDVGIDETIVSKLPENIITLYCQNNLFFHEKIKSIPIGIENTFPNKRKGHGVAWPHAVNKVRLLQETYQVAEQQPPTKLVYANFNTQTNVSHRAPIMEICIKSPFINWNEPSLNYIDFIKNVLDHRAVICPAGNGIDTHRLYEVLYCRRIPIIIKTGNYPIYDDLYKKLPVIILNEINDLKNEDALKEQIEFAAHKPVNNELLDFNYWRQLITSAGSGLQQREANFFERVLNLFK